MVGSKGQKISISSPNSPKNPFPIAYDQHMNLVLGSVAEEITKVQDSHSEMDSSVVVKNYEMLFVRGL
jgi:hypothetical protein